jgi:hypothetical protein
MRQSRWYPLLIPVGLAAVMAPVIVLAAGGSGTGFDAVVHGIESHYHVRATRIPFMSLISGIAGISTHGGVRGLHVAEIEHLEGPVDGAELTALVEQRVGHDWRRMIRETSGGGGEQTLIYVKSEGDRMGLLLVDLDRTEMNLVQLSVNPDRLNDEISHHHHDAHAETDNEDGNGKDTDRAESDSE